MSNTLSYQLFDLIGTLSKSEKRHFKLYAKRNLGDKDLKFLALFDLLDKMSEYNEEKVAKKFAGLKPSLLSNIKAHLYEQIMISLRLLNHKESEIRAGELFNFAQLLYQKGLYMQSLTQLSKAKQMVRNQENDILLLEVIEFEKKIESRHITRSYKERADELIKEAREVRQAISQEAEWLDMALIMYDYYLKSGHVKNRDEYEEFAAYFKANVPTCEDKLSFFGRVYRHQSYVWYNYIVQDFSTCYKHSLAWMAEFDKAPKFIELQPDLYMKGIHNCLSALFYCNERKRFAKVCNRLEEFVESKKNSFNINSQVQAFIYLQTARLNQFFLEGNFTKGVDAFKDFDEELEKFASRLDHHRVLIFWYKIACLYFGSGDFKNTIKYLNKIINSKSYHLREDVQCFARILNLVAHYELGNDDVIDYQIRSTYRFLLKMEDLQQVQQSVLNFIRRSVYMDRKDMKPHFNKLKQELENILYDKYESRPLLYLDLHSWLQSKIEDRPVEEVIQEKVKSRGMV